jgi:hypothetical protein
VLRFDPALPDGMGKRLAFYLALAIGFEGGLELAERALEAAARKHRVHNSNAGRQETWIRRGSSFTCAI